MSVAKKRVRAGVFPGTYNRENEVRHELRKEPFVMVDARPFQILSHLRLAFATQPDTDLTDGQLLQSFLAQRNEAAFATLVRRHAAMVLGVCLLMAGNHDDAEGALPATAVVLPRKAASAYGL